jgi:hypothetical protein
MQVPTISVEQALDLANAFRSSRQWAAAETFYRRIIASSPACFDAWNNLGYVLSETRALEEACDCFRRALAINPGSAEAYHNLGCTILETGRWREAIQYTRRAVELDPQCPEGHFALSLALLLTGDFREGWERFESRRACVDVAAHTRPFHRPPWSGESAQGKTLLVYAEQGAGDAIQFLRYLPLAQARSGAAEILLECRPELLRLFSSNLGDNITVRPKDVVAQGGHFDLHTPLMSLPYHTGQVEPLRMIEPYLQADLPLRGQWRERLAAGRALRVGVAWEGNPTHRFDAQRSIASHHLNVLSGVPGVEFHSLQVDPRSPKPANWIDLTGSITDFADTAALIAELDLVVTVDTSVAHLAGALGRPVWTLLAFMPDWRWGLEGEATPWYPTMRLFRQKQLGDWAEVIQRVSAELSALVAAR